jgi:hypothetical protein
MPPNVSPKQVERIHDAIQRAEPVFRRQTGADTRELVRLWQREADSSS